MERTLVEFVNSFDLSLRKFQNVEENDAGISTLTISQVQYIDAIFELGEPAINEIATKLRISKASTTIGVNKLAKLGYVIKTQSTEDKRVFRVKLTNSGNQLINAKYQALKAYGEFILNSLDKSEAKQFEATLKKLVKLFKKYMN